MLTLTIVLVYALFLLPYLASQSRLTSTPFWFSYILHKLLWTIKRAPFYFGNNLAKCWPNFTIFGRNLAEKICNIFMLCCSPHLFSVVTLLQENKLPFNYACTCESVPLTAAIMLMIKTYRLNKTIQIHNAYVSVITCIRSVHLGQIHNSEGVYELFIFQQDSASAHRARETVALLARETHRFIVPDLWHPNSPDLNPVDY